MADGSISMADGLGIKAVDGATSMAEGLGGKALDSNELRKQHKYI